MSSAFRPENALEEEMLNAYRSHDEQSLAATLAIADVYLPSDDPPPAAVEEHHGEEGDEFPLPVIAGPDGVTYIAAYSSLTQLAHSKGARSYRRIRGRDLARVAPRDLGLALNPGGELGFPLSPQQFAALIELPPPDDGETGYLIGEPKDEPIALVDAMRRFAESREDVRALYRALIVRSLGATPEHVIGLELPAGADADGVMDAAIEAGRESGLQSAAFLPIQPGVDSGPVGAFMLDRTKPFWTR